MAQVEIALLLQIAAACPAQGVPPERVIATAKVESGLQEFAIGDNTTRKSHAPATAVEAISLAKSLLAEGHSIDAGLMQVNDANWRRLGLTVETVFEPATNVCAGKQVLAEAYATERAVSCRYNTGKPDCGNAYPNRIFRAMQGEGASAPQTLPPVVSSVLPVFAAPLPARPAWWDVYGIARAGRPLRAQPAQIAPVQLSQR